MSKDNGIAGTIGMNGVILDRREGPFLMIEDAGETKAIDVTRVTGIVNHPGMCVGNELESRPCAMVYIDSGQPMGIPILSRSVTQLTTAIAAARKQWDDHQGDRQASVRARSIESGTIAAHLGIAKHEQNRDAERQARIDQLIEDNKMCGLCRMAVSHSASIKDDAPRQGDPAASIEPKGLAPGPLGPANNPHLADLDGAPDPTPPGPQDSPLLSEISHDHTF